MTKMWNLWIAHLRKGLDYFFVMLFYSSKIWAEYKHCSDLSYEVMEGCLSGEATQGIDDCANLPEK